MASRQNTLSETRLVAEFLAARFPTSHTMQHVRVGAIPTDLAPSGLTSAELSALGVWRRWVDAIAVEDRRLWVIEGGLVPDPGDVSRLQLYLRLIRATPELQQWWDLPARGLLVYAVLDPAVGMMAAEAGLVVEIYRPPWIDQYFAQRRPRDNRSPVAGVG